MGVGLLVISAKVLLAVLAMPRANTVEGLALVTIARVTFDVISYAWTRARFGLLGGNTKAGGCLWGRFPSTC